MAATRASISGNGPWSGAVWPGPGKLPAPAKATGTATGAQAAQAVQAATGAMQQGSAGSQQPISAAAGAETACHSSARTHRALSHWCGVRDMRPV